MLKAREEEKLLDASVKKQRVSAQARLCLCWNLSIIYECATKVIPLLILQTMKPPLYLSLLPFVRIPILQPWKSNSFAKTIRHI